MHCRLAAAAATTANDDDTTMMIMIILYSSLRHLVSHYYLPWCSVTCFWLWVKIRLWSFGNNSMVLSHWVNIGVYRYITSILTKHQVDDDGFSPIFCRGFRRARFRVQGYFKPRASPKEKARSRPDVLSPWPPFQHPAGARQGTLSVDT